MKRIRWGILGLGKHSRNRIIPAFEDTTSAELLAVGSSGKGQQTNPSVPIVSYEELISAQDIDAVFIALPNHLHAPWSLKAMEAGKHVLCEKPAVCSPAEATQIAAAVQATSCRFAEAFMYRFHCQHRYVRELLNDGAIGALKLIEAHFHYTLDDFSNVRLQRESSGGSLFDVGCYGVDLATWLMEQAPTRVGATWERPEGGVDYHCFAQLIYESGQAAHISAGCRFGEANHYTLYGTEGSIRVPSAFIMPRTKRGMIELARNGKRNELLRTEAENMFAKEIDAFSEMILSDSGKCDAGFGDYCLNAEVLSAVRRSAEEAREIRLPLND